MSHLFEDYREVQNVRDKLDFLLELVQSAPRRVFLTKLGEVQAVILSPGDYKDLWQLEFDRDMRIGNEEEARGEAISHEEFMCEIDKRVADYEAKRQ